MRAKGQRSKWLRKNWKIEKQKWKTVRAGGSAEILIGTSQQDRERGSRILIGKHMGE